MLTIGALLSFSLAIYVSLTGGLPILETAHAILFGVMALIIASNGDPRAACIECGFMGGEAEFCIGCGRYASS